MFYLAIYGMKYLDKQYNDSEDLAQKIFLEREEAVREIRKICAKNKTPFHSSRKDLKFEIEDINYNLINTLNRKRERWRLPLNQTEICEEMFNNLMRDEMYDAETDEDEDRDDGSFDVQDD